MHSVLRVFALIMIAGFAVASSASIVQPDDGPYYRFRRGRILYVYDSVARESIPQVAAYMEAVRNNYDASFNWKLDEEEDLVLTSPNQQIANAYATVSPNIASVWFPSGPAMLEQMAESSWFLTLATHETSHLYQLNAKGEVNSFLKGIFGNAQYIFPFIWPVFIHPNQVTPTFLIEGNAVLNESRANMGGRLYSGEVRALVLAQIKAGLIDPTRLINNEFRFPFGAQPYYQGAYFQSHLAAKYGVDKTNQFFLAQGEHYLWPFILNKTFRDHFGSSYPQEIHEYVREMQGLADKQQQSDGKVLYHSLYFSPLNHDAKRIFFLEADGIQPGTMHVMNKAGAGGYSQQMDLPLGKIFLEGDKPLAATSEQHDLHHIEYSLYGENHAFDPRFAGQIVNDQRGGKTVALDASNAWLESHVLVNGENYDVAHSLPILDDQGNIYYFRQNGSERILYKNRQSLFKYDGFYGKLMEVGADGAIYFIANSDYGATLYEYKDREITRVLKSDLVMDARQVDATHFLVTEVQTDGSRVVLTEAARKPQQPAIYSYGFPSYNLQPEKIVAQEQFKEDERSYNSLSQMRYSQMDFSTGYDSANGLNGLVNAQFVDPLQYQTFNLGFGGAAYGSQLFNAGYSFTKYLPQFSAQYTYQKEIWRQHNLAARTANNQQVAIGLSLPLLRYERWDVKWDLFGLYKRETRHDDLSGTVPVAPGLQETYGTFNSLAIQFLEQGEPAIGLYPWQSFNLNYYNKLESLPGSWAKKYNTSMVQSQYSHGFPMQFYANVSGNVAWAENHDISLNYNPMPLSTDIAIGRLVPYDTYWAKTAASARLEVSKVFNTPAYSARIPVSLERVAPLVLAQGIFLDSDGRGNGDYPGSIFEWGFGADVQVLLFHLAPAKLRFVNAFDTSRSHNRSGDQQVMLKSHFTF